MKDIIIFNASIARDLIRNGFKIADIQPDKKCKLKTVFYFKDTQELRDYLVWKFDIKIA